MATKAVKILDKNFHISLKLNDLPISVAVGLTFGAQISEPFIVYKEAYKSWIGGDKVHSLRT